MGAGGKEATLDVFEWHLKKLLYIIDKLPKAEREKAVLILRNSANHYSNLTRIVYSSMSKMNHTLESYTGLAIIHESGNCKFFRF